LLELKRSESRSKENYTLTLDNVEALIQSNVKVIHERFIMPRGLRVRIGGVNYP